MDDKVVDSIRTNVRFTDIEYQQIQTDSKLTGKSIPWLLKSRYFGRGIAPPALSTDAQAAVRRELAYIGNNLNQLAKLSHAGILKGVEPKISEALEMLIKLKHYLGSTYGHRETVL